MAIESKIRSVITQTGYITIDEMMRQVLSAHVESYYKVTGDIGIRGDFITAPEVSQLFGEVIAFWAIIKWQNMGCPQRFILLELGPGTGKMMSDLLRVARVVMPRFLQAAQVTLYEINQVLIDKQQKNLSTYNKDVVWIESLHNMDPLPIIIIANEFFDALPVKQFIKLKDQWFESVLTIDSTDDQIKYNKIVIPDELQASLNNEHKDATDQASLEESSVSKQMIKQLSQHIISHLGTALIIDYGYNIDSIKRTKEQYNSTLQMIKDHKYQPINFLGDADITCHVDFWALQQAAIEMGIHKIGFSTQRDFLVQYGIELRYDILRKKMQADESIILDKQLKRLIGKEQMGCLFHVLELNSH